MPVHLMYIEKSIAIIFTLYFAYDKFFRCKAAERGAVPEYKNRL